MSLVHSKGESEGEIRRQIQIAKIVITRLKSEDKIDSHYDFINPPVHIANMNTYEIGTKSH